MGLFDSVAPGTPIKDSPARKAAWLNAVSKSAAHFHGQQANGEAGDPRKGLRERAGQVDVRNLTGDDRRRGEVVQLGDELLTSVVPGQPWFEGNSPSAPVEERFAILLKDLVEDEIGPAMMSGVCTALVNVSSTTHRYAVPVGGVVLQSATSGPVEILSELSTTGEQEVHALIGRSGGTVTIARATEFIGVGGPLPYHVTPVPIKLLYGGLYGTESGYDWQNGDDPDDLGLWGVGTVVPVAEARVPVLNGDGDPVVNGEGIPVTTVQTTLGTAFKAVNVTGRWIFAGALVTVLNNRWIVAVDSPQIIYEKYTHFTDTEAEGYPFTQEFYAADGQKQSNPPYTDDLELKRDVLEMPVNYTTADPTGVRAAKISTLLNGESATFVHVTGRVTSVFGSRLRLNCIGPGYGTAGEGEGEFPGWPGPTPGVGTETMTLLLAQVNEATDVASTDATFAFNNATVAGSIGTIPEDGEGTCNNCVRPFVDDEWVLIAGDGTTWQAIKLGPNIIKCLVNESDHVAENDSEFAFDNGVAISGAGKTSGTMVNAPKQILLNNEEIEGELRNDKKWQPRKLVKNAHLIGLCETTIAAGAVDGTSHTITPGITASAVRVMQWDSTPGSLSEVSNSLLVAGVNLSLTEIRASTGEPIAFTGYLRMVRVGGDDVIGFVPTGVMDFRALPGFSTSGAQIPYHESGDRDFKLGGEPCP